MTPREIEEYRALRETIRERGTARVWIFLAGLVAWAALTVATAALAALPVATLLPLLVLAAGFESVFALHTAVERIGRYLQVFYENDSTPEGVAPQRDGARVSGVEPRAMGKWEQVAMAYGRAFPSVGADPLFTPFYILATTLNFVPVILAEPVQIEVIVVGAVHLLVLGRIFAARRSAARQRAVDLERFERLRDGP